MGNEESPLSPRAESYPTTVGVEGNRPKRIGIVLCTDAINEPALRFLVLQLNGQQRSFEFEFLPRVDGDDFLVALTRKSEVDREAVRAGVAAFYYRYQDHLDDLREGYRLKEEAPKDLIAITLVRFHDRYYGLRQNGLSVIALGDWERTMAPPSILEFILTLVMREAVASVSRSLRSSVHLGNKGCLMDFNHDLAEVRQMVLSGFVCSYCRVALESDGLPELADEIETVLQKEWIGKSTDPASPAGIISNLGHDLFLTKGLKATPWETFKSSLQEEGGKQLVTIVGTVIGGLLLAALLLFVGLKQPSDETSTVRPSPAPTTSLRSP